MAGSSVLGTGMEVISVIYLGLVSGTDTVYSDTYSNWLVRLRLLQLRPFKNL